MSWFTRLFGKRSRIAHSSNRSSTRLRLEELEPRWVPSGLHTSTSTNWSGYAVTSPVGSVTGVSADFTVPTVTGSGTAYSSAWVGIDGYNSSSVEQTGIEADVSHGVAQYSAWYEMYPSAPVTVNLTIRPKDQIFASVQYANGNFTLTLDDLTTGGSVSVVKSDPTAQRSSAEWIEEAPSSNSGVLPLANFGATTFTNAQATIVGANNTSATGPINNPAWASEVVAINMVSSTGTVEASTSTLNTAGTGFTVTYGATTTPPSNPTPPTPPVPPTPPTPPVPPTPPTPPSTGNIATATSLVAAVNPFSRRPSVTLTAIVSPSVPRGSTVELMSGSTVLATGRVEEVGGVEEVTFTVTFFQPGTYTFTAVYLGSGQYQSSTSKVVTVTVG